MTDSSNSDVVVGLLSVVLFPIFLVLCYITMKRMWLMKDILKSKLRDSEKLRKEVESIDFIIDEKTGRLFSEEVDKHLRK